MSDEAGAAPVIERSYSVPQVVKMTGIPATTIRVAIRAGELPAFSVTGGPHGTRGPRAQRTGTATSRRAPSRSRARGAGSMTPPGASPGCSGGSGGPRG